MHLPVLSLTLLHHYSLVSLGRLSAFSLTSMAVLLISKGIRSTRLSSLFSQGYSVLFSAQGGILEPLPW